MRTLDLAGCCSEANGLAAKSGLISESQRGETISVSNFSTTATRVWEKHQAVIPTPVGATTQRSATKNHPFQPPACPPSQQQAVKYSTGRKKQSNCFELTNRNLPWNFSKRGGKGSKHGKVTPHLPEAGSVSRASPHVRHCLARKQAIPVQELTRRAREPNTRKGAGGTNCKRGAETRF